MTCSNGTPNRSATIWANIVLWPWPWVDEPTTAVSVPSGSTRDGAALAARARLLDERGHADADDLAACPALVALAEQGVVVGQLQGVIEQARVVAAVVGGAARRLVRELVRLDEVAAADLGGVQAELRGRPRR